MKLIFLLALAVFGSCSSAPVDLDMDEYAESDLECLLHGVDNMVCK